jgi:hypothetical protein
MVRPLPFATSFSIPPAHRQKLPVLAVMLLAGITHAANMLRFPFYDNVEGLNMASAWSILHEGSLSPYTYIYDNPPLGWVLLAVWLAIGRALPAAGTVLALGRFFMLLVHLLTVLLIYGVARRLRLSQPFALFAVLLFSLSPLAIILQRRILVENLMILWVLLALYSVLGNRRTLLHYATSAGALGIAFLTHVAALSFFPAIFYLVYKDSHRAHRRFALTLWLAIVIGLSLGFPLQALLKEELLPAGVAFGGSHPHVSFYETQSAQLERIAAQEFLHRDSSFMINLNRWLSFDEAASDRAFIGVGLASAGLVIVLAMFQSPHLRPLALLLLFYGLHLATLQRLFDPGIIPLLPFLAISVAIVAQAAGQSVSQQIRLKAIRYPLYAALAIPFVTLFSWTYLHKLDLYQVDQTSMQFEAVRWISQHAPADSLVVTDSYAFVDLRQSLPNAHYYWAVDEDPQVRDEVMANNWCSIDYLLTTPQMLADMAANRLQLSLTAHRGSVTRQRYENNGWPIDIREVGKHNCNIPFP